MTTLSRVTMALALVALSLTYGCNDSALVGTSKAPAEAAAPATPPMPPPPVYMQPTPVPMPPLPIQQTFGGPMNGFHIGDSNFSSSSDCAERVRAIGTEGRAIEYTFTVTQPDTTIQFRIDGLCGIDYNANTIVTNFGRNEPLPSRRGSIDILQGLRFGMPGMYSVVIRSGPGSDSGGGEVDYDDFMFASMTLTADKPIQIGTPRPLPQ